MKAICNKIKNNPLILVILLGLLIVGVFYFAEGKITGNHTGAPLDDTFIHLQFAKNIAAGNGFAFNPGESTPGSTSPLWTILLASFSPITSNYLTVAKILSAVFFIATGIVTYCLGLHVGRSKKFALIAAFFMLLSGRLGWATLSGMEITLSAFLLTLIGLLILKRKNMFLIAFLWGLAALTRPEAYLFFGFYLIYLVLGVKAITKKQRTHFYLSILLVLFIFAAVISPYLIFTYKATGGFLPNTFEAQSVLGSSLTVRAKLALLYILRYGYLIVTDNPLIAVGVLISPLAFYRLRLIREFSFLLLVTLLFPIAASIVAPNLRHHGRYIMPLIPFYIVTGLFGIRFLISKWKILKRVLIIGFTIDISYLLILLFIWAQTFGWNAKNINDMQVHLGYWVEQNTPKDSVLALNDIGAITYISERQIIDIVGLVSPEVLKVKVGGTKEEKEIALWTYLEIKQPDYLIIFPSWYPYISTRPELQEIYRVKLDRYTIVDGEMVVYNYQKLEPQ